MEEDIKNYSPTVMMRGTPCICLLVYKCNYFLYTYLIYIITVNLSGSLAKLKILLFSFDFSSQLEHKHKIFLNTYFICKSAIFHVKMYN